MTTITIERLEKAINDCKQVQPPVDYVLGPDLRKLATVWGEMIAKRQRILDIDTLPAKQLDVLRRWLGAAAGEAPATVCQLGSNEAGDCEACQ